MRGLACVAALACACATARVAFPTGPTEPAPDAVTSWQTATEGCRGAKTFSAEIHLNGRVGDQKVPSVTLQGAMTRNGEMRLLAVAFAGSPIFTLAGRTERATLVLPRDHRVLTAPTADIIAALVGIRLTPVDWLDLLSGCVAAAPAASGVRIAGATIVTLEAGAGRLRLEKDGTSWRIAAGERPDLLVEYREYQGRWPSVARVTSRAGAAVAVSLNMTISQIFVNTSTSARTFALDVPSDYSPMTLDELRAIGPLGGR
jgi:hypothetical protein